MPYVLCRPPDDHYSFIVGPPVLVDDVVWNIHIDVRLRGNSQ